MKTLEDCVNKQEELDTAAECIRHDKLVEKMTQDIKKYLSTEELEILDVTIHEQHVAFMYNGSEYKLFRLRREWAMQRMDTGKLWEGLDYPYLFRSVLRVLVTQKENK